MTTVFLHKTKSCLRQHTSASSSPALCRLQLCSATWLTRTNFACVLSCASRLAMRHQRSYVKSLHTPDLPGASNLLSFSRSRSLSNIHAPHIINSVMLMNGCQPSKISATNESQQLQRVSSSAVKQCSYTRFSSSFPDAASLRPTSHKRIVPTCQNSIRAWHIRA